MVLKEPERRSGQKILDLGKVTPNCWGVRSVKLERWEIFPDLQSRRYGGCVGLYLHYELR